MEKYLSRIRYHCSCNWNNLFGNKQWLKLVRRIRLFFFGISYLMFDRCRTRTQCRVVPRPPSAHPTPPSLWPPTDNPQPDIPALRFSFFSFQIFSLIFFRWFFPSSYSFDSIQAWQLWCTGKPPPFSLEVTCTSQGHQYSSVGSKYYLFSISQAQWNWIRHSA